MNDQLDESSNNDSDLVDPNDILDIPLPIPLDVPPPLDHSVDDDAPEAPAPANAPDRPPTPPPVPAPHPPHCRGRNRPVGDNQPSIAHDRPCCDKAGISHLSRTQDNIYGDENPVHVNARTDPDGDQWEAETFLAFLAAAQSKASIPQSHKEAM